MALGVGLHLSARVTTSTKASYSETLYHLITKNKSNDRTYSAIQEERGHSQQENQEQKRGRIKLNLTYIASRTLWKAIYYV